LKIATVKMLDQRDDVAADAATAAVPYLLLGIDAEAVMAAAQRAGPAAINPTA
jgi:hypothetical protein